MRRVTIEGKFSCENWTALNASLAFLSPETSTRGIQQACAGASHISRGRAVLMTSWDERLEERPRLLAEARSRYFEESVDVAIESVSETQRVLAHFSFFACAVTRGATPDRCSKCRTKIELADVRQNETASSRLTALQHFE